MKEATSEQGYDERVDELAEEFVQRQRAGETVTIDEYVSKYPKYADAIRHYFPLVETMEQAARVGDTVQLQHDLPTVTIPKRGASPNGRQADDVRSEVVDKSSGQLFGRYVLQRQLGRGAMGTVWLAHDSELDRLVALKLPEFEDRDTSGPERFRREARSMATVQHPNLCPIYDVGEIDGRPFLTMAFVDGPTLSEFHFQHKGNLNGHRIANIVRKLALALDVAHQADVIHRDVKPTNVMINSAGEPILMDFGLARRNRDGESEITQDGSIVGSPAYMSPEQVEGTPEKVGPQTDVYSLGVILYELLCGRRPFEGTVMSVLGQIMSDDPPPPSDFDPDVDPRLEAICLKALSRSLSERHTSASELADELNRYLNSNADTGEAKTTAPASPKKTRRTALSLGLGILMFAALAATIPWLIRTPHGDVIVHAPEDAEVRLALMQKGEVVKVVGPDENWTVAVGKGRYDLSLKPMPDKNDESITSFALRGGNSISVNPDTPAEITIEWKPRRKADDADTGNVVSPPVAITQDKRKVAKDTSHLLPAPAVPTTKSTGKFVDSGQRIGNAPAEMVRLADLDGDGDLDVFVGSRLNAPDAVYLNDGHGRFTSNGQELIANNTYGLAFGDVDDDGDLDAIAAGINRTILWLNDGNAQFLASTQALPAATHVEFGDLDGDQDLDIVVACRTQPSKVLFNDGNGNFEDTGQQLGSGKALYVAIADLDDDQDLDVYLATETGLTDAVYLNDGHGRLSYKPQQLASNDTRAVSLVDWNGDGHLDALLCSPPSSTDLWINDGHGLFTLAATTKGYVPYCGLATGDVDGDGDADCLSLVSYGHRGPISLLINNGVEEFAKQESTFFGDLSGGWPALGDLDGDGDLDAFVASCFDYGPAQVWWNVDTHDSADDSMFVLGDFSIPGQGTWGTVAADFDQDNDIDLFVPSGAAESHLWLNRGNGQFDRSEQQLVQKTASGASAGDLDGDGDLDLYVSSSNGPDHVWLNDGRGQFSDTKQRLGTSRGRYNHLADFDGDGDPDVLVLRQFDKPWLWFNQGNGQFGDHVELPTNSAEFGATGDLDGDGDIDLILVSHDYYQPLHLYMNDGQGRFKHRESGIETRQWQGILIKDTNNDGHVDIVAAGCPNQSAAIYHGNGKGEFHDSGQDLSGLFTNNVVHADFDRDGHVDLLTGGARANPNQVLLNDGKGNFQHVQWLGNSHSTSQVADLDGDGDIDIIESSPEFGCRLWLNQTLPDSPVTPPRE